MGDRFINNCACGERLAGHMTVDQIAAALASMDVNTRTGTGSIKLTLATADGAERDVTVPASFVRLSRSPGGTEFETRFARGRWQTRVIAVGSDSTLEVGDILAREFSTKEKIDHPSDIEAVLLHGTLNSLPVLQFAILRSGAIDTASLSTDGAPIDAE